MSQTKSIYRYGLSVFALGFCLLGATSSPVDAQGSLVVWRDGSGQLSEDLPVGNRFVQVGSGSSHGLAIDMDGEITAWGNDFSGQVSGAPTGPKFVQVAAAGSVSMALSDRGKIWSWGSDAHGQVTNTPTGSRFTQIAVSETHSAALLVDGSIVSWGNDQVGVISGTPTGTGFLQIATGIHTSIALRADGSMVAWGWVTPTPPPGTGYTQVAAGELIWGAMRADGSVVSWGHVGGEFPGTPTEMGFTQLVAGVNGFVALRPDGSMVGWWHTLFYEDDLRVPAGTGFSAVSPFAAIGRDTSGTSYCFGDTFGATGLCPCTTWPEGQGNMGEGCRNSTGTGGVKLRGLGVPRISADTFQLLATGAPDGTFGVIMSGALQLNEGHGYPVGSGILCVGGLLQYSQFQVTTGGTTTFTNFLGQPFGAFQYGPGVPTNYQFWYRDPSNPCNGSAFNFSNAWTVSWKP